MITDIFDNDIIMILTLFSVSPGSKFARNEIKEKTMLNNVPLDNAMNLLLNNGVLNKEKRFFSFNFENKNSKAILNIIKNEHLRFKEIPLKIYYLLLDASAVMCNIKNVIRVYLFGSYAKLIYTDKSDVDLAVILKKADKGSIDKIKKSVNKAEKKYGRSLELHFFEKKDMQQKDPIIKEILRNNVELFGKNDF